MKNLLMVAALMLPTLALAHGDAAWIQHDPRYTMRSSPTTHCCDSSHCRAVGPDFATRIAGGWRAPTGELFEDDGPGLYISTLEEIHLDGVDVEIMVGLAKRADNWSDFCDDCMKHLKR